MISIGDELGFDQRIEAYRRELVAHCYRMLGSVHDAEDLAQETYLRAWRAREQYDPNRSSLRTWMYRIATNACLTALAGGARRPLPSGLVAASAPLAPFVRSEVAWLQPVPDALVEATDRGSLRLAFVAALQYLSARQRAVLILRDVLGFSAAETAEIIGGTVISVNSALRRARVGLEQADLDRVREPPESEQRAWVDAYLAAFVSADIDGLKRLLAEDVLMEMPPMENWFVGRDNYAAFMARVYRSSGTNWRAVPVAANGQRGLAAYRGVDGVHRLHTLQVFTVSANGITRNSTFQDDDVFAAFGLAPELPT